MDSVKGVVEAIGTKFNGSLKVNGVWYNMGKGVSCADVEKGNQVELNLKEWEFKGKTGTNVSAVNVLKNIPSSQPKEAKAPAEKQSFAGRDFDAENRGKVRHGLMVAALPLVLSETVTLEKAKELVIELTTFIMEGK